MRIIEIAALENGAHRNQTGTFSVVPDGWAVIPEDMETPNFPFGDITVDDSAPPVVTSWTPGIMPEPEPVPEPEAEPTVWDERVTALEETLAQVDETAIALYEAQVAQEEVNAAQDEALIELYEMIGG